MIQNRLLLSFCVLLVILAGCGKAAPAAEEPTATPQVLHTDTALQAALATLPAQNSAGTSFAAPEGSAEEPLRFTLPTPGPQPISLWRPALYDTPWALGPHDHFFFTRPIGADEVNWPVADYRYGGIFFSSDIVHTGIDIPAQLHTPVMAAGTGKVVWAGYGLYYGNNDPNDPYGLAVTIRHNFGYNGQYLYTVYAHMDRVDVITGQNVETGDALGIIGMTGLTTGPHLHFEVRSERNSYFATFNPELWLAPPQGWGVLVGQLLNTNGSLLYQQDVYVKNLETRQRWSVRSYGNLAVNSDLYYKENLVLSDLPAGEYEITIPYLERDYQQRISIYPGAISYFTFQGDRGFDLSLPSESGIKQINKDILTQP
jgi:murein DD-endopeptidase MepM/ murein hydrolase activator NlpD